MDSIRQIYKIGYGPSSSHTMGPGYAAEKFLNKNKTAERFEVELFGSLALTGKGHMTDEIIERILGKHKTKVVFNYSKTFDYHANAMEFRAYTNNNLIDKWLVFSVGGGDLKEENEERFSNNVEIYPHRHMNDILEYCERNNLKLYEYVEKYEGHDIRTYMKEVLETMEKCIKKGIFSEGVLPGRLKVVKKAPTFYQKYLATLGKTELVYAYSLAVSEENASCNVIVTAPTCGASAVVPAILFSQKVLNNKNDDELINALLIGGLIGNIVKHNASISGAEVGCQGEVGVACSMASAMLVYLLGGDNETSEYAAEIALEHHLGLTCDPIDGLVQIPCIERNAISALAAYNIAEYAMLAGSKHTVTFDSVINVMRETGKDLKVEYRETSTGGLAVHNK